MAGRDRRLLCLDTLSPPRSSDTARRAGDASRLQNPVFFRLAFLPARSSSDDPSDADLDEGEDLPLDEEPPAVLAEARRRSWIERRNRSRFPILLPSSAPSNMAPGWVGERDKLKSRKSSVVRETWRQWEQTMNWVSAPQKSVSTSGSRFGGGGADGSTSVAEDVLEEVDDEESDDEEDAAC